MRDPSFPSTHSYVPALLKTLKPLSSRKAAIERFRFCSYFLVPTRIPKALLKIWCHYVFIKVPSCKVGIKGENQNVPSGVIPKKSHVNTLIVQRKNPTTL